MFRTAVVLCVALHSVGATEVIGVGRGEPEDKSYGETVNKNWLKPVSDLNDMPKSLKKTEEGRALLEVASKGELQKQEHQYWEWQEAADEAKPKTKKSHKKLGPNDAMLERKYSAQRSKLEDKFAKVAKQVDSRMADCHSPSTQSGWAEPKKFDLLISWWTGHFQSNIKTHEAPSLLQESSKSGFENQAEIKYALRSFEKQGLLDYVNNVYLLIDQEVIDKHGAPRFFNYSNKAIKIVTDKDMGVRDRKGGPTKWRKFLGLNSIKGLSDYFLWVPDDNFMLKPFKMEHVWDPVEGKPLLYSYGSFSLGWCDNLPAVGSTHGPVFMNKCAYNVVADNYWRLMRAGGVASSTPIDAPCLFTNAMRSQWKWKGQNPLFHRECHTNAVAGCVPWEASNTPLFLNVQGNGISDEYALKAAKESWGAKKVFPNGPERFFHDNFPKPSRFEI